MRQPDLAGLRCSEHFTGCRIVRHQHIDEAAAQGANDSVYLGRADGDADHPRDPAQGIDVDGDDAPGEFSVDEFAVHAEQMTTNVTYGT
jgi:hypothetical protein